MPLMLTGVSLIRSMQKKKKHNHAAIFNVGSFGLHSIYGTFQTGKIFKSMFKLFNKSPTRRDLYITINNLNVFPKRLVLLNLLRT